MSSRLPTGSSSSPGRFAERTPSLKELPPEQRGSAPLTPYRTRRRSRSLGCPRVSRPRRRPHPRAVPADGALLGVLRQCRPWQAPQGRSRLELLTDQDPNPQKSDFLLRRGCCYRARCLPAPASSMLLRMARSGWLTTRVGSSSPCLPMARSCRRSRSFRGSSGAERGEGHRISLNSVPVPPFRSTVRPSAGCRSHPLLAERPWAPDS